MAKVEFREERCKGCALCIEVCPKHILSITDRSNRQGYRVAGCQDMDQCTGCALCAEMCPDIVIEVWK